MFAEYLLQGISNNIFIIAKVSNSLSPHSVQHPIPPLKGADVRKYGMLNAQ